MPTSTDLDSNRVAFWYAGVGFLGAVALVILPDIISLLSWPKWTLYVGYIFTTIVIGGIFFTIHRTAGITKPVDITLVTYSGYDHYLRSVAPIIRRTLKINIITHTYMGEDIFPLLQRVNADLLIFDIEHRSLLTSLTNERRLISLAEISRYASQFPDVGELVDVTVPALIPRVNNRAVGFPIRIGTNAISYNRHFVGHHGSAHSLYDLLFGSSTLSEKLRGERRIGIWNRQSVVMGLISLAIGHKSPYRLSSSQFTSLCEHLTQLRRFAARLYWGPSDYLRLREDLNEGLIWLGVGGGEWHVDTRYSKSRSKFPHIEWSIPKEGALLWVESVGITHGGLARLLSTPLSVDTLVDMIRTYLLSVEAQHALSVDHLYAACPASYHHLMASEAAPYAYSYLGFASAEELTKRITDNTLVFREGPPQDDTDGFVPASEWNRFWTNQWL